jgi:hypothetical protein
MQFPELHELLPLVLVSTELPDVAVVDSVADGVAVGFGEVAAFDAVVEIDGFGERVAVGVDVSVGGLGVVGVGVQTRFPGATHLESDGKRMRLNYN